MILIDFLTQLNQTPEKIEFSDTIAVIDALYVFTPMRFTNGDVINEAGENSGSCKLLTFAKLHGLNETEVLACFGKYYRDDVLQYPVNTNHQNIRHFMQTGWGGVRFDGQALGCRNTPRKNINIIYNQQHVNIKKLKFLQ